MAEYNDNPNCEDKESSVEQIKKHLDEYHHLFKDKHTDRLLVSAWDRNTVADGNWLTTNTIAPLSARDVYLAECIEDISAKQVVYEAGKGININPTEESPNHYTISVDDNYKPFRYTFNEGFDVSEPPEGQSEVSVKLKTDDKFLKVDENKNLYCNAEEIENWTKTVNNVTVTQRDEKLTCDYTYKVSSLNLKISKQMPNSITTDTIYIIGG